jgi:glycosyltransferase involved in cell wall biosynthesis
MDNSSRDVPALTIVITTWNRASMALNAIESVLKQDCLQLLEIVVVDDGSTDETPSRLANLEGQSLPRNRLLRVIRQDHRGRAGALQEGINGTSAPYVALLSSDDTWEPQRARELLAEELRLGSDVLIYTDWKEIDAAGEPIHGGRGVRTLRQRAPFQYERATDGDGVLRAYVTSVLHNHCFASCASVFPRDLLTGIYALIGGMATPDLWVALVGYLRCKVAYLDVTSLRRTIHARQQHKLAEANLWPGLAAEQVTTADAIVRLLEKVVPDEWSMISVMRARRCLLVLRESCRKRHRLSCLAGSLRIIPVALIFPALWITVLSNVLLAVSPTVHDAVRYGRARHRLARATS